MDKIRRKALSLFEKLATLAYKWYQINNDFSEYNNIIYLLDETAKVFGINWNVMEKKIKQPESQLQLIEKMKGIWAADFLLYLERHEKKLITRELADEKLYTVLESYLKEKEK